MTADTAAAPAPPRGGVGRWLLLVALAGAAVVGVERLSEPPAAPPLPTAPAPMSPADLLAAPAGLARNYDEARRRVDVALLNADDRARTRADEWLALESLAKAYMARGRLTGTYDDYAAAQAALDRAFAVAEPGAGPHLTQAALHFTLHRLAAAEAMLARIDGYAVPPDAPDRAEMALMRGDIAFYRGDYAGAARRYAEARRIDPGATDAFRWAVYHSKTGDLAQARADFERAAATARRPTPQARANLELQRGILELDAGRYADALACFRAADAMFPGWWLIEEHIAEATVLMGDPAAAERRYAGIVERTGNPEFIDALAVLRRDAGDADGAAKLFERSRALWERRLTQFPEAAYGHAIGHFVDAGDTARAVELARANVAARPYGDAQVALAEALLAAGRPAEAARIADAAARAGWRTLALRKVRAAAHAALRR